MTGDAKQELGPNQKKWIEALRSGQYKQGRHYLRPSDDKYCCLGVACEVFKVTKQWVPTPDSSSEGIHGNMAYGLDGEVESAPEEVIDALALYGADGDSITNDLALTMWNDTKRSTFAEIANMLEAAPQIYFREPR